MADSSNIKKLSDVNLGSYFVSPFFSLKTDKHRKTIWLDLDTDINVISRNNSGAYNFQVNRVKVGTIDDFHINLPSIVQQVYTIFKGSNLSFEDMLNFAFNPETLQAKNPEFAENLKHVFSKISHEDKQVLRNYQKFLNTLPTEGINKLIKDKRYSFLSGDLNEEDRINVVSHTEKVPFKNFDNLKDDTIMKYFEDIILDRKILNQVFIQMNLEEILRGEMPTRGGSILVDMGGTGKSMIKRSLKEFWEKELNGEVKERSSGDISSFVNAAFQAIQAWYLGIVPEVQKVSGIGDKEENLVEEAKKRKVPSLMIIDEAEDFILDKKNKDGREKQGHEGALNALKRFIQEHDKGGVTGYVVTLMIANLDEVDIHKPLAQGAERLKITYFGPPKEINEWERMCQGIFNDLEKKKIIKIIDLNIPLLSELIFEHNKVVGKMEMTGDYVIRKFEDEIYCVKPRNFIDFCKSYRDTYRDEKDFKDDRSLIRALRRLKPIKKVNFGEFIDNFINLLLEPHLLHSNLTENDKLAVRNFYARIRADSRAYTIEPEKLEHKSEKSSDEEYRVILNDEDTKFIKDANDERQFGNNEAMALGKINILINKFRVNGDDISYDGNKITDAKAKDIVRELNEKLIYFRRKLSK